MVNASNKAYVIPVAGREDEIAALIALIEACGCILICAHEAIDAYEQCVAEADVVVLIICPETIEDKVVDEIVELANASGKRIVGVWGAGADPSALPPSLHRHGDAVIRALDADVADAICQAESPWLTPEGAPRPAPKTPRHKKR